MRAATGTGSTHTVEDQDKIDLIIKKYNDRPGRLLSILEKVQENHPHKFLPADVLDYVAEKTDIPKARVYSVVTFYALFNLEPQGAHIVSVCRGTACHTRGSRNLLEHLKLQLGLSGSGQEEEGADKLSLTTPDRQFTLRTVACFGQCALAPVVEVDHNIVSHVNTRALDREIEAIEQEENR